MAMPGAAATLPTVDREASSSSASERAKEGHFTPRPEFHERKVGSTRSGSIVAETKLVASARHRRSKGEGQ
jgi:hypothetical protein